MGLEEAILKYKEILTEAMAADNKWLYLVSHLSDLVEAGQVIIAFAIGLFVEDDRVGVTAVAESAGVELHSALIDTLGETDKPAIGPMMWIAIAQLILKLLLAIQQRRN